MRHACVVKNEMNYLCDIFGFMFFCFLLDYAILVFCKYILSDAYSLLVFLLLKKGQAL